MPEDSGFFQINDIELNIPPEQITIDRKSMNYSWQSLRTTSSTKLKSGYSQLDITCRVMFTGNNKGYAKLRNLVAQFRVTPFCYVENQYLRNAIMHGNNNRNMALALKNMVISKATDENSDVIEVVFYFTWFNYFPFTSDFVFKREPFMPIKEKNPANSLAWKLMYQAEINRARNINRQGKGLYKEISANGLGNQPTTLEFTEYQSLTVAKYNLFKRETRAVRQLREYLRSGINSSNDIKQIIPGMFGALMQKQEDGAKLLSDQESSALMEELFGSTTSLSDRLFDNKQGVQEIQKLLDQQLSSDKESRFRNVLDQSEWFPTILTLKTRDANGNEIARAETVSLGGSPDELLREANPNDNIIVERQRKLSIHAGGEQNIILTGISISFQNILAVLPVKGYTYPTFQHIGSVDAVVTLSFIAKNKSGICYLTEFYNTIEDQAISLRQIPQGQRNLFIHNDLVNMCGLAEFIPDSISTQTIPGSPGHSAVNMTLLNNPLTSTTRESLVDSKGFINNHDIKQKIARRITDNLRLIDNAFSVEEGFLGLGNPSLGMRSLKTTRVQQSTIGPYNEEASKANQQKLNSILSQYPSATITGRAFGSQDVNVLLESGYFLYKGAQGDQNQRFKEICIQYGRKLGSVLLTIAKDILSDVNVKIKASSGHVAEFFSLTEDDVYSISILQDIINQQIMNYNNLFGTLNQTSPLAEQDRLAMGAKALLSTTQAAYIEDQRRILQAYRNKTINNQSINLLTDSEKYQQAIEKYAEDTFSEWQTWTDNFIENLISSDVMTLPQFADILAEIELLSQSNTVTAYPDFPLLEVINIMQQDKNLNARLQARATKYFKAAQVKGIKLNNTNLASLLEPDFYLFDSIGDTRKNLIGSEAIEAALTAVRTTQRDLRAQSENDWFSEVYDKQIVGEALANDIKTKKLGLGNGFFSDTIKKLLDQLNKNDPTFAASDLIEENSEGLSCSTAARKEVQKPIELQQIHSGWENIKDGTGYTANKRDSSSLLPPTYYSEAKHRYGVDAIDYLSASNQTNPGFKTGEDDKVIWGWPTGPETRRITSRFSLDRPHPTIKDENGNPIRRSHKGMDLGSTNRQGSFGNPIYAAADGEVIAISYSKTEARPGVPYGGEGVRINIKHANGYSTRYYHMQWDEWTAALSERWWGTGVFKGQRPGNFKIYRGERIGSIGLTGGISSGAHLHFEVRKDGVAIDPETIFTPQTEKLTEIFVDADPQNKSLLTRSVEQFEKGLATGQGFGIMRAYPTFRLYFIESDMNERKRFKFDDFFHYSAVVSIELIRSRKIAADLLILRVTNTSGVLNNRKFRNTLDPEKARDEDGNIAKEESSIASLMLKPGTQIQLALGYTNNVDNLEVPFNGVITDVQSVGTDDILEITCQSFAIELVQNTHGKIKSFGGFLKDTGITGEICEQLMAEPELVHFGRWHPGSAPSKGVFRSILTERWTFTPQPADDNIFAPTGRGIFGLFDSTPNFILYHSTIWDTFQELKLRHPSMIAYPVPYEGFYGPRMTMFFGTPDQLYFARDPAPRELNVGEKLKEIARDATAKVTDTDLQNLFDANIPSKSSTLIDIFHNFANNIDVKEVVDFWVEQNTRKYALNQGIIKPFRSYHLITSHQHILHNNITSSLHNVFNTVTIQYDNKGPEVDEQGNNITGFLKFDDRESFTLRCDAALPDEEVREMFVQFPNCVGDEMAKRYSLSLLQNSLKDGYKGTLTIVGNPSIKPYDICYLFDHYNDMYGPIEVEQVVLSFNQNTGFITEITPDMCVHVNEHTTMATQDALGLIAESWIKDKISSFDSSIAPGLVVAGATAVGGTGGLLTVLFANPIANMFFNSSEIALGQDPSSNPLKLVGAFIFSKAITRTQLAHPFRYSPLVKNGQPMLGGLPKQLDTTFIQGVNKWVKDGYKGARLLLSDTMDKINPNNWIGHSTGNFGKSIFNQDKG